MYNNISPFLSQLTPHLFDEGILSSSETPLKTLVCFQFFAVTKWPSSEKPDDYAFLFVCLSVFFKDRYLEMKGDIYR